MSSPHRSIPKQPTSSLQLSTMADEMDALLQWLNTFDTGVEDGLKDYQSLSDGVVLVDVLAQVDDSHFSPCSSKDFHGNEILVKSNIKKLISSMKAYYHEVLGQRGLKVDISADLVKDGDVDTLCELVKLVLGVAVQCENKQVFINNIMNLDGAVQQQLMMVIQSIMAQAQDNAARSNRGSTDENAIFALQDELQTREDELEHARAVMEELSAENKQLKGETEELKDELSTVRSSLATAEKRIDEAQSAMSSNSKEAEETAKAQIEKLKGELETVKRERERALSDLHEVKGMMEERDVQMNDLKKRADEAGKLKNDNRDLTDEIDVMKGQLEQLEKMEGTVEKYKHKLEEMGDVRKQLKSMEDQMQSYIDKNLDLEEQLRKGGSLKPQVDKYREQIAVLEEEKAKFMEQEQKNTFEITKLTEKLEKAGVDAASSKKLSDELKDKIRKLEQDKEESIMMGGGSPGRPSESFAEFAGADLREKVARLERENKLLKEGAGGDVSGEMVQMLESQVDDANKLKAKFQQECLAAKQQVTVLEDELKETKINLESKANELQIMMENTAESQVSSSRSSEENSKKIKELQTELETSQLALVNTRRELVSVKQEFNVLAKEHGAMEKDMDAKAEAGNVGSLSQEVARLDSEVQELKDRLKRAESDVTREREEKEQISGELRSVREEHIADMKSMLQEKDSLNKTIQEVKEKMNESDIKLAQHESTLTAKDAEMSRLANDLERLSSEVTEKTAKLEDMTALNAANEKQVLELKLASSESEKADMQRAGQSSGAVQEIHDRLEKKTAEVLKLTEDKKKLEKYMTQARQMIQDLNKRNKETEDKLKDLAGRLDQQSQQYQKHFAHENEELKKELAVAKRLKDEARKASEEEMRLVTSAFYEIGLELQRVKMQNQQANLAAQQAAQQKESTTKTWLGKMRKGLG